MLAGQSANYGQINEKVRQLSGRSGATLEFRIIPIFVTEGRSDLTMGLSLGLAFVVRASSDRQDGSGC
jgi:hypothetical protein